MASPLEICELVE